MTSGKAPQSTNLPHPTALMSHLDDDLAWGNALMEPFRRRLLYANTSMDMVTVAKDFYVQAKADSLTKKFLKSQNDAAAGPSEIRSFHEYMGEFAHSNAAHAMRTAAINFLHVAIEDVCKGCLAKCASAQHPKILQWQDKSVPLKDVLSKSRAELLAPSLCQWIRCLRNESLPDVISYMDSLLPPAKGEPHFSRDFIKELDQARHNAIHHEGKYLKTLLEKYPFESTCQEITNACASMVSRVLGWLASVPKEHRLTLSTELGK